MKKGIFISPGSRCCKVHLDDGHLTNDALEQITHAKIEMFSLDSQAVLTLIDDCCSVIRNVKTFDFDDPTSLDDETYRNITGIGKGKETELTTSFPERLPRL